MPAATRPKSRPSFRRAAPAADSFRIRRAAGLQILECAALGKLPWLVHGLSTRPGGKSTLNATPALNLGFTDWDSRPNVEANRRAFLSALGAKKMPLLPLRQFHSDVIHLFDAPGKAPCRADASITKTSGLLLAVQTADCVPILLADTRRRVVAAVHAGWRGTLQRIAAKAIGKMRMTFGTNPRDVLAALGPAIGRCCYEVGPEVANAFASQFPGARDWFDGPFDQLSTGEDRPPFKWLWMTPPGHDPPPPRVKLDLIAANTWQLADAGVPARSIFSCGLCTACRTDLFFSYRREGPAAGRMMSVIGIR